MTFDTSLPPLKFLLDDETQSHDLQLILYSLGADWTFGGNAEPYFTTNPYLYLTNGIITIGARPDSFVSHPNSEVATDKFIEVSDLKYVKIKYENEAHAQRVQATLLRLGYEWINGDRFPQHTGEYGLAITRDQCLARMISSGDFESYSAPVYDLQLASLEALSAEYAMADRDAATQSEKSTVDDEFDALVAPAKIELVNHNGTLYKKTDFDDLKALFEESVKKLQPYYVV